VENDVEKRRGIESKPSGYLLETSGNCHGDTWRLTQQQPGTTWKLTGNKPKNQPETGPKT